MSRDDDADLTLKPKTNRINDLHKSLAEYEDDPEEYLLREQKRQMLQKNYENKLLANKFIAACVEANNELNLSIISSYSKHPSFVKNRDGYINYLFNEFQSLKVNY